MGKQNKEVTSLFDIQKVIESESRSKKIRFKGMDVEVSLYLPVDKKLLLARTVFESSLNLDENGYENVDLNTEYIALVHCIAKFYTDLKLTGNVKDDYDILVSSGLFEVILDTIGNEFENIEFILNNIKLNNEVVYTKSVSLDGIISRLPHTLEKMVTTLKNNEDVINKFSNMSNSIVDDKDVKH